MKKEEIFKELNHYVSFTTKRINRLLALHSKKLLSNITVSQIDVLYILQEDKDMRMKDIGEKMGIKPSSTTNLVDKLIKKGLIKRFHHPDDRRMIMVQLTKKGENLLKELDQVYYSLWEKILKKLDENKYEEMLTFSKDLKKALDDMIEGNNL